MPECPNCFKTDVTMSHSEFSGEDICDECHGAEAYGDAEREVYAMTDTSCNRELSPRRPRSLRVPPLQWATVEEPNPPADADGGTFETQCARVVSGWLVRVVRYWTVRGVNGRPDTCEAVVALTFVPDPNV